jgi:hypothetical protein
MLRDNGDNDTAVSLQRAGIHIHKVRTEQRSQVLLRQPNSPPDRNRM